MEMIRRTVWTMRVRFAILWDADLRELLGNCTLRVGRHQRQEFDYRSSQVLVVQQRQKPHRKRRDLLQNRAT